MNAQQARDSLRPIKWQEGKVQTVAEGPYRYRIVVHCSQKGRQKAIFANGEHPYFCYVELLSGNGQWIKQGNGIVPVLPDGRVIMVVEQRPAQSRYPDGPTLAHIGGKDLDLRKFGGHSSLEFPGGAVNPAEGLKAGFLRELQEETGVGEQFATCYSCLRPVFLFGSDIAIQHFSNVAYLSGFSYQEQVPTDGRLSVLTLTPDEVRQNIWKGVICSGQAALTTWYFYEQVEAARKDPSLERHLLSEGYFTAERMRVSIP